MRIHFITIALGLSAALTAGPSALAADPTETKCGFLTIQGLSIRQGTYKCESSNRTGKGGRGISSIDSASVSMILDPNIAFLSLDAERDVGGIGGFKLASDDDLRASAHKWADRLNGRNFTQVLGGPFRHMKFNITDKRDWACAYGEIESGKHAWGTGAPRAYAWVQYCERGSHTISDDSLRKLVNAVQLD